MNAVDQGFAELVQQMPQQRRESGLIVSFDYEAVENEEKSKVAGRLVCDEVEYVSIRIIGDADVRRRPATDEDRQQYAAQYEQFKRKQPQIGSGTPLANWAHPKMNRARVMEAASIGIHSVEELAGLQDGYMAKLGPGWREIRQGAQDFLKQAAGGAVLNQLRSENDALKARLTTLEEMLAKQAATIQGGAPAVAVPLPVADDRIAKLEALVAQMAVNAAPKKRGRPRKDVSSQPHGVI